MIDRGKHPVLGVNVDAVDYEHTVGCVVRAAELGRPCAVSALAVHGVMEGARDAVHARRLNGLDLVVPDGQPVRWALRWLHGQSLPDRVYGPELMLRVLGELEERGLPIYLYGSTSDVLTHLERRLGRRFPRLQIAGSEPSRFRRVSPDERDALLGRIARSGARAVFVGLGCPRQEVFAYENRERLGIPVLAVGAAFDFHAGLLPQAPPRLQRAGLEWLFRLWHEPRRLWQRYLLLNPLFLVGILRQRLGLGRFTAQRPDGAEPLERFG
jgi:exopolysaccharide biosynthesis WecB/TagA/CpsF family protein